jgi:hypothetical protein
LKNSILQPIIRHVPNNDEYTVLVRRLVSDKKASVAQKHIEIDRAYREITVADVAAVLKSGKVISYGDDLRLEWVGKDIDGRTIKLLCRLHDADGEWTLSVSEALSLSVNTAYQVGADDRGLRQAWLADHPEWREKSTGQGHVERVRR